MDVRECSGYLDFYLRWTPLQLRASNGIIAKASQLLEGDTAYEIFYHSVARQHPKRSGIFYRDATPLAGILRGCLDPLSIMFQGTDMPDFYENLL